MGRIKDFKIFMPIFFTISICVIFLVGYSNYRSDVKRNIDSYNEAVNKYSNVIIENESIQVEINKYNELVKEYNSYKNSYPDNIDQKIEDLKNKY